MVSVTRAELPTDPLFFAMTIKFWFTQNGHTMTIITQSKWWQSCQLLFVLGGNRQYYWNGLICPGSLQKTIEMLSLQIVRIVLMAVSSVANVLMAVWTVAHVLMAVWTVTQDFRLLPCCILGRCSSGLLFCTDWQLFTNIWDQQAVMKQQ
jgi:hypothetical protein